MGFLGTIVVLDVKVDVEAEQSDQRLEIPCEESKATVAGWSYLSKYIISGHEDGTIRQWDPKVCACFPSLVQQHRSSNNTANRVKLPRNPSTPSRATKTVCKLQTSKCHPTAPTSLPPPKTKPPK